LWFRQGLSAKEWSIGEPMKNLISILLLLLLFSCDDTTTTNFNPDGDEGGACLPDGSCNGMLICLSDLCVLMEPSCGDGTVNQAGEECDNTDFQGVTCQSLDFTDGSLNCSSTCFLDLSQCTRENNCEDGFIGGDEECDGVNLDGQSCNSFGFHGGQLSCSTQCDFDLSQCESYGFCDDGIVQLEYEECDGLELEGTTCQDLGYQEGELACDSTCAFDISDCSAPDFCGNGVIDELQGETCDGTNIPTCRDMGFWAGETTCSNCALDTSACVRGSFSGTEFSDYGRDIAFDSVGNMYVTGYTYGGIGGESSNGGTDGFLTKYTSSGIHDWTIQVGNGTNDWITGLTIDFSDNVYIAGRTYGDFNGETAQGGSDIFLAKYDGLGTHEWTRMIGTADDESPMDVTMCPCGTIVITGSTTGSFPGFSNGGNEDAIVTKYTTSGSRVFLTQWGTPQGTVGQAVVVESSFQIYVAGRTNGSLNGNGVLGGGDVFLSKITPGGVILWTKVTGTDMDDSIGKITLGPNGYVAMAGYTQGAYAGFSNNGGRDVFLQMNTTDGTLLYTTQVGGSADDEATSIVFDNSLIYLAGNTQSDLGVHKGSEDIFVMEFDGLGMLNSTIQLGTVENDSCAAMTSNHTGALFITGSSQGDYLNTVNQGERDVLLERIVF
jgi:Beta-propeller repeat